VSVSSISFWQQDQNYWNQAAQDSAQSQASSSLIGDMFGASTTLSAGLASIANQQALSRVNSQLTSAVQDALNSLNGGSSSTSGSTSSSTSSTSSSSSSGSSTSSSSSSAITAPATGTGKVPLSTSTSLFTLGVLAGGTITVNDGTNTTIYKSTGKDTVGDLINAINTNVYGNAQVTASLSSSGQLVVTANNQTASILVGGAYAANVGFGAGNNFFQPTAPASTSGSSSSTASGSSSTSTSGSGSTTSSSASSTTSSTSSTQTSTASSAVGLLNSALALQTGSTAETLLSSNGMSGSLIDLLA
jgi:hypothetical protein